MSAKQGGSFATLLLTIPLAAIPLMALVGIPEFSLVTAAEDRAGPEILRQPSRLQADGSVSHLDASEDYRDRAADLFAPQHNAVSGISLTNRARLQPTTAAVDQYRSSSASSERSSADLFRPSPRPMPTAAIEPIVEQAVAERPLPQTSSGLTWRAAARQLEEIGITNYRLERGHRADRFLFACLFSPGSDPRILQRFEAESTEPLAAVEDVLTQVDHWLEHHYAEGRRWVR